MPFPLAHPAAVLPLQRFCPRYLSFPALIIGSLSPDMAYCFGRWRLADFSHRFFAGSFGFCLPAGLLMLGVFALARRPCVELLPARHRTALLPLCARSVGTWSSIVVSLLLGAWTHLLLDGITHEDGWLVVHLPLLFQSALPLAGGHSLKIYDLLYGAGTFFGVAWLGLSYLRWLESALGPDRACAVGARWGPSLGLAFAVLFLARAGRGGQPAVGIVALGIIALLLVAAFLGWTGWFFSRSRV
jgi:hypothetical protein